MGNQLIKDTNIDKDPIGKTGISTQWEMYSGKKQDKNKLPVTIFLFDKKAVAKLAAGQKEECLTLLRKEPQSLAKFRHPNIISLVDPLLEDPKSMGFVTESVKGSLHTLINANRVSDIFPTEIDTKFHILDLAETIKFLHNDVKSAHLSISPENIYVLPDEKWKLGGFSFVTQVMQNNMTDTTVDVNLKYGDIKVCPSMKFSAPEVVNTPSKCNYASDIFSLGCVIYTIYKINADKNTNKPYLMDVNSPFEVKDFVKNIHKQNFSCIPEQIRPVVQRMLHPEPNQRISINDFVNNAWFKDPFIQTVKHLENLYQREIPQQVTFLKGLTQIILKFEKKFVISKILPLLNTLIRNPQLASAIIPIYFKLIDVESGSFLNKEEFHSTIWPIIKGISTGRDIPAQALYLIIQNANNLIEVEDIKEIQIVFVPLLIKAFECGVQKLQVLALKKTEGLFSKIEYPVSKSQILPRILNLCCDNNSEVRKEALILLSKIYPTFDKGIINDQVLTTLEKVRKLPNNNYKINMTILSIFEGISNNIGVEVIANKIILSMIPMLVDRTLSKPEYKAYLSTVKTYLKKIEDEGTQYYQGMSDLPPKETEDAADKSPFKVDDKPQIGGEFAFLESIGGGQTGQAPSDSGVSDFDFTGFDSQFGGSNQPTTSSPGFSAGTTSSWQNPTTSTTTNQNKNDAFDFGGFSNPTTKSNPMTIKPPQTKTFTPLPTSAQNKPAASNQNMFANMKVNANQPKSTGFGSSQNVSPGMGGGWDSIENEIHNMSPSDPSYGGFNTNQPSNMNMFNQNQNTNQGFGFNNNANTGGFGMGSTSNQNAGGWDNIDLDMGGFSGSTNTGFNNNANNFGGMNMNNNNAFGNMNNAGNTFGMGNQGGFGQSNMQQSGGFNKQAAPQKTFAPMKLGGSNTQQQKPSMGMKINNPGSNPFGSSDDFFSSFDVNDKNKKSNPFNQGGHGDLL